MHIREYLGFSPPISYSLFFPHIPTLDGFTPFSVLSCVLEGPPAPYLLLAFRQFQPVRGLGRRSEGRRREVAVGSLLLPLCLSTRCLAVTLTALDSGPFREPCSPLTLGASASLACSFQPARTSQRRPFHEASSSEPLECVLFAVGILAEAWYIVFSFAICLFTDYAIEIFSPQYPEPPPSF